MQSDHGFGVHGGVHGGADHMGVPRYDFSTNSNACGPCPAALQALQQADATHYPDPHYTDLRAALAQFHGVAPARIVVGGSSSELIHRLTGHALRRGATQVTLPQHHYGDYAQALQWGPWVRMDRGQAGAEGLHWACEPSSPLGLCEDVWPLWASPEPAHSWRLLDCAYRPLWLEGEAPARALDGVWQLWTPNKALGLTGVRAAYAIAPQGTSAAELAALRALAPSWVTGAHGVALLQAWVTPAVQQWLAASRVQLRAWKAQQLALCARMGWAVLPGHQANYFVAHVPLEADALAAALAQWRGQGLKLRDCASFGLPGRVRLGVLPPPAQQALAQAWAPWADTGHHTDKESP